MNVDKYQRGRSKPVSSKKIKNAKLRTNLKRLENKFNDAAKSAASTEYLLMENNGLMEEEDEMEKTFKVTQDEILKSVDIQTKKKRFDLKLNEYGPYVHDYSRSGNNLLLGGSKGHIAAFDWKNGKLSAEINVGETVRAVKWLQNDNQFFAVAQKKYTYIYDANGVEVHQMKRHVEATKLEYLPYHYLLVTGSNSGFLKYHDVSTGQMVAELRTKLGPLQSMVQNPSNAVINAGHTNGTVTLWTPTMGEPAMTFLSAKGPVRSIAVNRDGRYMATAGQDRSVKIWDIRNIKDEPVQNYYTPTPSSSLHLSDTGLLAAGWGPHVQVWKDVFSDTKQHAPYMNHLIPGSQVSSVRYCPFEDVLGVGHAQGFSSLIVPGSGEANFDSLEANPFHAATKTARRENEVRSLMNKLQPEMITLDPNQIGNVDTRAQSERLTKREQAERDEQEQQPGKKDDLRPNPKVKGKNSGLRKHMRKKASNVVDERRLRIEANLAKEKEMRQKKHKKTLGQDVEEDNKNVALSRFQ